MAERDSLYSKFILMQSRGVFQPFSYKFCSAPEYKGFKCTLWSTLYHRTIFCNNLIQGQTNQASGMISFLHKVLSPVVDFSLDFAVPV